MFLKEAEGALVPMPSPVPEKMKEAAAASSDGRGVSAKPGPVTGERWPFVSRAK